MKTHWKKLTNPDYLGAYALEPDKDLVLTIKSVVREMVTGTDGKKEECSVAHFCENVKPMILNVTNSKTIEKIYSTPYIEEWVNCKIQVFATSTKVAGVPTECLRIRPTVPRQAAPIVPKCTDCNGAIQAAGKMTAQQVAEYTKKKYDKPLCGVCAAKLKAAESTEPAASVETAEPVEQEQEETTT